MAALVFAGGALATLPALAQSFEQTVNFIFTGNIEGSAAAFGDPNTFLLETEVVAADPSSCRVRVQQVTSGPAALPMAIMSFPEVGAASLDPFAPFSLVGISEVDLNAISRWKIAPQSYTGNIPTSYAIALDGIDAPVMATSFVIPDVLDRTVECTSQCNYSVPPSIDTARWEKAMDYLFEEFCTGTQSAF